MIETSVYGIWNLDLLRYLVPPFCVSDKLKEAHVHILGYVFSLYPIFLISVTWLFIHLYDDNYRPIVILFRPIVYSFAHLRRGWEIRNDVINVFATFFLLSYSKLMIQSLRFIRCEAVYTSSNETHLVALADNGISCYGKEHIPYLMIGYMTLFFLLAQTLALVLYPVKRFKACLSKVKFSGYLEVNLNIFVEKFYSCYRDGLSGGRDMRSFSGLYFILRIILVVINDIDSLKCVSFYSAVIFSSTALFIAFVKPYKRIIDNLSDTLLLALLSLSSILFLSNSMVCIAVGYIPLVVFLFVFMWKCLHRLGLHRKKFMRKLCSLLSTSVPSQVLSLEASTRSPLLSPNSVSMSFVLNLSGIGSLMSYGSKEMVAKVACSQPA